MKADKLKEHIKCSACGGHVFRPKSGIPLFWVVKVSRYGLNAQAVNRRAGLAAYLGSQRLAQAMGTDEDMARPLMDEVTLTVCNDCDGALGGRLITMAMDADQKRAEAAKIRFHASLNGGVGKTTLQDILNEIYPEGAPEITEGNRGEVAQKVEAKLKEKGFAGLYYDADCSCTIKCGVVPDPHCILDVSDGDCVASSAQCEGQNSECESREPGCVKACGWGEEKRP